MAKADDKERRYEASSFIVATGGILGGGIATAPGYATESIFQIPVDAPEGAAGWGAPHLCGGHAFARRGGRVGKRRTAITAEGTE